MKKLCKTGKWLLSLVCSLCVAVALLPKTVHAAGYGLYVGGVEVTDSNASNITSSSITNGTVSYNASTKTLTLNNATITGGSSEGFLTGILSTSDIKIELIGTNSVSGAPGTTSSTGIGVNSGNLEITGNGKLNVWAGELTESSGIASYGIYVGGSVTVSGGCSLYVTAQEEKKRPDSTVVAISCTTFTMSGEEFIEARTGSGYPVRGEIKVSDFRNYTFVGIEPQRGSTYSIALSPTAQNFTVNAAGTREGKTITVRNTGTGETGELTVALSGTDAGQYVLSATSLSSIAAGGSTTFTVTPKADLVPGNYTNASVSVTGSNSISASAALSLAVSPEIPRITGNPAGASYAKGTEAAPLTVSASVSDGTLSYQWAKGSTEASTDITGATSAAFVPPTDTVGTETYFCKVTNTVNGMASTVVSGAAAITVSDGTADPETPGGSGTPEEPETSGESGSPTVSGTAGASAVSYQIMEGAGGSWTAGSSEEYAIRGNGEFSKFTGVKMDGNPVDAGNYTAREGSTIIAFREAYLSTLSEGVHTAEIVWTDGSAATTFTVSADTTAPKKDDVPKTGEDFRAVWLLALAGLSGMGLLLTKRSGRRNEKAV